MTSLNAFAAFAGASLFAAAMIRAAVLDVLTMTVSNRLVVALLVAFLVLAPASGWTMYDVGFSLAAAMIVLFASAGFFALGWIGGGDGKLASVVTLWIGAAAAFDFITYTALFGGICGLGLLAFKRMPLPPTWLRSAPVARLHAPSTGIPYAVAIALAALLVLPTTPWIAGTAPAAAGSEPTWNSTPSTWQLPEFDPNQKDS